jgi:hypothetical protein
MTLQKVFIFKEKLILQHSATEQGITRQVSLRAIGFGFKVHRYYLETERLLYKGKVC